jgi:hypothetical protein
MTSFLAILTTQILWPRPTAADKRSFSGTTNYEPPPPTRRTQPTRTQPRISPVYHWDHWTACPPPWAQAANSPGGNFARTQPPQATGHTQSKNPGNAFLSCVVHDCRGSHGPTSRGLSQPDASARDFPKHCVKRKSSIPCSRSGLGESQTRNFESNACGSPFDKHEMPKSCRRRDHIFVFVSPPDPPATFCSAAFSSRS